jgi:hypothetical protein
MKASSLFLLIALVNSSDSYSESIWSIEIQTGSAYNLSTTLQIQQANQSNLEFDADYATKPWEDAPYYGYRISRRKYQSTWEIEFLHHKLYLENNPPEVQRFEITHGYNMLFVNHVWNLRNFDIRAGGGIVISHTESTIRNLPLETGYDLSGIAGQLGASKRLYLSHHFFLNLETKFTFSHASVSINQGDASVPNIALHGLVGIGYDFR